MNPEPPDDASAHIARRERLAVLCALDRATLRLILRTPAAAAPAPSPAGGGLGAVLTVAQFCPGAIGRWSRRLARGGGLLRGLL
jgi:hypothetical protein